MTRVHRTGGYKSHSMCEPFASSISTMSLCQHCISGVLHEGTPEGKFEIIDGVNTYIALPPAGVDYPKDKAVLILTGNYDLLCEA